MEELMKKFHQAQFYFLENIWSSILQQLESRDHVPAYISSKIRGGGRCRGGLEVFWSLLAAMAPMHCKLQIICLGEFIEFCRGHQHAGSGPRWHRLHHRMLKQVQRAHQALALCASGAVALKAGKLQPPALASQHMLVPPGKLKRERRG